MYLRYELQKYINITLLLYKKFSRNLPQEQEILCLNINYKQLYLPQGTDERRKILKMVKYFHCTCKRCEDPTEFESHLSTLLCSACDKKGYMLKNAQEEDKWQCQNCKHQKDSKEVEKMLNGFQEEILQSPNDIYKLEMILQKISSVLHPNHYLIIDVKQNIAAMLRMILNNPSHCPGRQVYERKIELCEDILKVLNTILPDTISRLKSITLYELVSTMAEYHRMRYKENELNKTHLIVSK